MKTLFFIIAILNIAYVYAEECANSAYFQCGGNNWKGLTCCQSGYICKEYNSHYSMCVQSNETQPQPTTTQQPQPTTTTTTKTTIKTTTTTTTTTTIKPTQSPQPQFNSNLPKEPVGYASLNGGTTGGKGGNVVVVSNQSELNSALKSSNPIIIGVKGIIKLSSDISINKKSNFSIIGMDNNSGFTGAGFFIKSASNIIIQNIKFSYCLGSSKDCLGFRRSSNIWIDHCEFYNDLDHGKDYYDGLVDFTYASDFITVSWTYLHNHSKGSLVGHSDNNGSEDTGKLHITYHHNYFKNIISRLPSLRFGTGHIFNNVYENIEYSCVNSRMGAQVLVEGNVFRNANHPIVTNFESVQEGYAVERNNDFGNNYGSNSITRVGNLYSVPYKYSMDNVNGVYNQITRNVGPM